MAKLAAETPSAVHMHPGPMLIRKRRSPLPVRLFCNPASFAIRKSGSNRERERIHPGLCNCAAQS